MKTIPTPIDLDPSLAKRLVAINDKTQALQMAIQMAQANWERRGAEIAAEGREAWQDIAARYGIDLKAVNWTLSDDAKQLVPVAVKLA